MINLDCCKYFQLFFSDNLGHNSYIYGFKKIKDE